MATKRLWLMGLILSLAHGQTVEWESRLDRGSHLFAGTALVDAAQFQESALLSLARQVLAAQGARDLVVVNIFTRDSYPLPWIPKLDHGNSYDWMAGLFPDGAVWRECRITAMKGGAILEIQDGKDRFRRRVLRGSDPLILPVHGVRVRILSIVPGRAWVASAGLPEAPPTKDRVTRLAVYAYARKGVNAEVAKGLTLALSGKLPVYELQVTLSDSPWFINDSEHPGRWPYMENVRFPSRAEHLASKSIVCQSDDRGIMCKQTAHY